jgi:transposase
MLTIGRRAWKRYHYIDKTELLKLTHCPDCGEPLSDSDVLRERIIEDIPDVKPLITKFVIISGYCKRCRKLVEPKVTEALPKSRIGLNLLILTAWLHYGLGTTIHHILEVLNYHLHFKLSPGGLVHMWNRLYNILAPWYEYIAEEARRSAKLYTDETGWRVNGITNWLWCFTNERIVCFMIDRSRGHPALKEFFKEVFEGVLITDFWKAYGKFTKHRQVCFVHLFRELAKVSQKNVSEEWAAFRKKLTRWMRDAIRLDKNEEIAEESFASRKERLRLRLNEFIGQSFTDKDCKRIQKRLRDFQHALLTFLDHDGVASDNNKAEREIRPAVIMRKNSGQNKSEKGADMQAVLMSIYRTLKLRGHNPMYAIHDALVEYIRTGKLPPFPEPVTSGY